MAGVLPDLADALHGVYAVLVHQSVTVRGGVQDVGTEGVVVRNYVVSHDLVNVFQWRVWKFGLPEPGLLEWVASHRRKLVGLRRNLVPSVLLVAADVRVEQSLGRVLRPVQVHHKAVRLDAFDKVIKLRE